MSSKPKQCNPKKNRRKTIAHWWTHYEWPVILVLGIFALVLGYIGFDKMPVPPKEHRSWGDLLYLSAQLFVLESGSMAGVKTWELEVARVLAPALALYTAVQALMEIFREQFQSLRLWRMRNHVVVCGLGRKGLLLAKGFRECGHPVVVIEQDHHNPRLHQCRELGVAVLVGDTTDKELLKKARAHQARHLVAVTGDDGTNAEIACRVRELARSDGSRTLTCYVHITDPELCDLLSEWEVGTTKNRSSRLEFFSVFDAGARNVLRGYLPSSKDGKKNAAPFVVVVGAGRMGQSLIVHAARNWWMNREEKDGRLRIAVVDRDAQRKLDMLHLRYPRLEEACELVSYQIEIESTQFQQGAFLLDTTGERSASAVYVCVDDNSLALTTGLMLLKQNGRYDVPVIVRMTDDSGLATLVKTVEKGGGCYQQLHAFGLLDQTCTPHLIVGGINERLARAMHDDYMQNELAKGQTTATNPSLVPWDELPEHLKESNRRQADHVGVKLQAVNCELAHLTDWDAAAFSFEPDEVEQLAQLEHKRWMNDQLIQGWSYAPGDKNQQKRTHPCLMSWEELPDDEKDKDRKTVRNLPRFLISVDLQIRRVS